MDNRGSDNRGYTVFGSFSGLRMNSDKTKVIWIGCKKHSKDKLNVTARLEWGVTNFTLLGMEFSTDLEKIPEMNYNKILTQASKIIKSWQYRILTPISKINVIKTLVLSKFNHLFISVPVARCKMYPPAKAKVAITQLCHELEV